MNKQAIICGYGKTGRQVAGKLTGHNFDLRIIEMDGEIVDACGQSEIEFIRGDARNGETLLQADILNADALVVTLPDYAGNADLVATALRLNPVLKIICKVSDEMARRGLENAGAHAVVCSENVVADEIVSTLTHSDIHDFLRMIYSEGNNDANLVEFLCCNMNAEFLNRSITDLKIRVRTGVNIIGMKIGEQLVINPSPNTKLSGDIKLFVLGTKEQIEHMKLLLT